MACLVARIHYWVCIARFLKHIWACLAGNARIGSQAERKRSELAPAQGEKREGCEVFTWCLLQPLVSSSLISSLPCPSNLHNGASIRGKLYTKKMHIDATVPFSRLVCSFVDRTCSISCSRSELFWTNFIRFVAHDRLFEISFDQQPNLAVLHNIRVASFLFRRS